MYRNGNRLFRWYLLMTLNQLRYFCTASRCHSITKAAEELYVTQPTVSVAIRDLEIEFGISLFYRKGNRLILTEEGEELYNKATYILQYCNELQADYSSMARVKPPLRIGIPPMLSTVFFPELLIAFLWWSQLLCLPVGGHHLHKKQPGRWPEEPC